MSDRFGQSGGGGLFTYVSVYLNAGSALTPIETAEVKLHGPLGNLKLRPKHNICN